MALQSSNPPHCPTLARSVRFAGFTLLMILLSHATSFGQAVQWQTGSRFQNALAAPTSVTWESRALRDGLQTLAKANRVAVFLDRRCNPGVTVSYSCDNKPLEDAFRDIAAKANFGVGFVGPVVYVGPSLTAARIATLAEIRNEQVKKLPNASHKRLLKRTDTKWPELIEPRLVLARMATEAGLTVNDVELVPHDIWEASDLPPMTFGEKATLVTAGFDMSFRWHKDARKVSLARFPRAVSLQRAYGSNEPQKLADEFKELIPQAFIDVKENGVIVGSMLEDHWKIERRNGQRGLPAPPRPNLAKQRYSLRVENKPVGVLIKTLAKKLDFEVILHPETPKQKLEKLVSFSVKDATNAELFEAMAKAAKLRVQFDTGKVYVIDEIKK